MNSKIYSMPIERSLIRVSEDTEAQEDTVTLAGEE